MTSSNLTECLRALRWSQRGLASLLRKDERAIRRWVDGSQAIPSDVLAWLRRLAEFHIANPPPPEA